MTTTDYLIDSVLVLLVLLQIRERTLTTKTLIRPLLIVGIAVANLPARCPDRRQRSCPRRDLGDRRRRDRPRERSDRDHAGRPGRRGARARRLGIRVLLGPRDGFAVRVYLLDHPQRRRIDRRFQWPTCDYRERVDGRAARHGGVRSGRPLGVDGGSPSASARSPRFRIRLTPLPSLAVFTNLTGRTALTIRLVGLALVSWTVLTASHHPPGDSGRGLVISVLFVVCVVAWLTRIRSPTAEATSTLLDQGADPAMIKRHRLRRQPRDAADECFSVLRENRARGRVWVAIASR